MKCVSQFSPGCWGRGDELGVGLSPEPHRLGLEPPALHKPVRDPARGEAHLGAGLDPLLAALRPALGPDAVHVEDDELGLQTALLAHQLDLDEELQTIHRIFQSRIRPTLGPPPGKEPQAFSVIVKTSPINHLQLHC